MQGVFASAKKNEKLEILVINKDKGDVGNKIIDGINDTGYFKTITSLKGVPLDLNRAKKELANGKYKLVVYIPEDATDALNFKKSSEIIIYVDPVLPHEFAANITNAVQTLVHVSIIQSIGEITINVFNEIKAERLDELKKLLKASMDKRKELKNELVEINKMQTEDNVKEIFNKLANTSINELENNIRELQRQIDEISSGKTDAREKDFSSIKKNNLGLMVTELYYIPQNESTIFPNSVQQNVPGWTIFALFWIVQIITINFLSERQTGVFTRIKISPATSIEIILGKFIPFFLVNMIQAVVMFSIGVFILPLFGTNGLVIHNITGVILITISLSFAAISFGLLLATTCRTMMFAAAFSALLMIVMTIIGGIMVPRFVMPSFMQNLSLLVPQGWALDGYINIFVREYSTKQILINVLALLGFGAVFFGLSLIFYRKITRIVE
jgi:ABC-2 type transport system permease protein